MRQGKRKGYEASQERGGWIEHAGECPDCGKLRWVTKRMAKTAAQQIVAQKGGGRLSAYACGDYWHLGHLPRVVTRGEVSREQIQSPKRRNWGNA